MFNPRYLKIILFTLLFSSLSACSSSSGDYGPFTLMIESEDGKKVEDIIVNLTFITHTFMGKKTDSYNNIQVVNSGEIITFPRGFVTNTEDRTIGMYVSISHPDYNQSTSDHLSIRSNDNKQMIDLGKANIKFKKTTEKNISWFMANNNVDRGEAIILNKKSNLYYMARHYSLKAYRIDRGDLVEKYLALKLTELYGDEINSEKAKLFEQKVRDIHTDYGYPKEQY